MLEEVLAGAWLPMAHVFETEGAMELENGTWEYLGHDDNIHGPFSSGQMVEWRNKGFFEKHEDDLRMRLSNAESQHAEPPPPARTKPALEKPVPRASMFTSPMLTPKKGAELEVENLKVSSAVATIPLLR
jgi:hypothetical protein